jgi:hypothetical protein
VKTNAPSKDGNKDKPKPKPTEAVVAAPASLLPVAVAADKPAALHSSVISITDVASMRAALALALEGMMPVVRRVMCVVWWV